jgi:hypothetical protein
VLLPSTSMVVLLLRRLLRLLGLRRRLLLRLPLLVLLQLLRGEEDLDLLAIRARLHAVGLSLRGELHLRATATAATAAAAATCLSRLTGGPTGLPGGGGALPLVGALVAVVIALVILGGGVRAGIRRGWDVLGVAVLGILAHASY